VTGSRLSDRGTEGQETRGADALLKLRKCGCGQMVRSLWFQAVAPCSATFASVCFRPIVPTKHRMRIISLPN
jgi:hypothetical protein